jgi:hypothetical protein
MFRRFINAIVLSGLAFLVLSISSPAISAAASDTVAREINDDFSERKKAPDFSARRVFGQEIKLLEKDGKCPLDGAEVKHIRLPSLRSYSEISREAYLCEKERAYWIKLRQGAFRGERTSWYGPFVLGTGKKSVQGQHSSSRVNRSRLLHR